MAMDYAKVLVSMGVRFSTIGRGPSSAHAFQNATGLEAHTGGLERFVANTCLEEFTHAIVCVGEARLGQATKVLIEAGMKSILVEKPGASNVGEITQTAAISSERRISCFVGYNRRFYASVQRAQQMIQEDGGVASFLFEFTEWSHRIKDLTKEQGVLENWFLHNSTHVVDMAFYLGGWPERMTSISSGGTSWHPAASVFAGAGVAHGGATFSYGANWEAPGRFSTEILTRTRRMIFRPLEQLRVVELGSVREEAVELDDRLDVEFKPGLWKQVNAFLSNETSVLPTIQQQAEHAAVYEAILHGGEYSKPR